MSTQRIPTLIQQEDVTSIFDLSRTAKSFSKGAKTEFKKK